MAIRGIRGATSVTDNSATAILTATKELLTAIIETNSIITEDIASIFFTSTAELDAIFPAKAARELGYTDTPLMCAKELEVVDAVPMLVRILIHVNSNRSQSEFTPIYLGEAKKLRKDL